MKPIFDRFLMHGRLAVVTGGLGQLGLATGRALVEAGATVVLADVQKPKPGLIDDLVAKFPGRIFTEIIDVTKPAALRRSVEKIEKKVGAIDVWVNNAGIAVFTPFSERTEAEFDKVLDVNVRGVFQATKIVSERMRKRGRGVFVNVGSIYGVLSPDPRIYADSGRNSSEVYGATKAAVIQMSRYFAVHLAPNNIRVNSVTPGGVFNNQSKAFVKNYSARTPMARMAHEDEIAAGVLFLASDASSYVNGHNLIIDGGFSAW